VSAQDNGLAFRLRPGSRAATLATNTRRPSRSSSVSNAPLSSSSIDAYPAFWRMSWPGGTRSPRPPGPGLCPASVVAGTTSLVAVYRSVTKDLRAHALWLAAALTSGLPSICAPRRPAEAPPSFPCRYKVYGSHTGLRECPGGRGQGMTCGFLGLRHGQTRGLHHGVSIEEIAQLVGHASTRTTEVVYRRELRPVITTGAEIMDEIFARRKPLPQL
jgi:hypothetical protein